MKWWLILLIALIGVIVIAFLSISVFLGSSMTKVERIPIEENPSQLGLKYENVTFVSRTDDITLCGWFLPAPDSERVIIMVHGGECHRADPSIKMLDIAFGLVEHGYNVLMFDLRAHGESGGDRLSIGYYEKRDLLGAVDYLKRYDYEQIGVLGFSMGGATTILATVENEDIDCIVTDSSFADMIDMLKPRFEERTIFPGFFLDPMLFMVKIIYGIDFKAVKPVELVHEIAPRPIFFIHGGSDNYVSLDHAYRLQQASQNPQNQLWVVPQADHVKAYCTQPEQYIDRVTTFFDEALK